MDPQQNREATLVLAQSGPRPYRILTKYSDGEVVPLEIRDRTIKKLLAEYKADMVANGGDEGLLDMDDSDFLGLLFTINCAGSSPIDTDDYDAPVDSAWDAGVEDSIDEWFDTNEGSLE
jgi:hypothetical protein